MKTINQFELLFGKDIDISTCGEIGAIDTLGKKSSSECIQESICNFVLQNGLISATDTGGIQIPNSKITGGIVIKSSFFD